MSAPSVLVVDDDDTLRQFTAGFLADAGFAVAQAADGGAALQAIGRDQPDALVLDLEMPRLDGLQVLESVRSDPRYAPMAILVLSGVDDRQSIERCLELGADGYVLKPFSAWELEARVRSAVRMIRYRAQAAQPGAVDGAVE